MDRLLNIYFFLPIKSDTEQFNTVVRISIKRIYRCKKYAQY